MPTQPTPDLSRRGSGTDSIERLTDEITRVAESVDLLRRVILIGGVIVLVLIGIGVIIELDMLHLVNGIKVSG